MCSLVTSHERYGGFNHRLFNCLFNSSLTYWGQYKIVSIWKWHFQMHFYLVFLCILIRISLKFDPKVQSTLIQIMGWCRKGDKPLIRTMKKTSRLHITVPLWRKPTYTKQQIQWKIALRAKTCQHSKYESPCPSNTDEYGVIGLKKMNYDNKSGVAYW